MFKHILLPIDTSELSQAAAQMAIELAHACHARLTALYVILPELAESTAARVDEGAIQYRLDQIVALATARGVSCDACMMHAGEPWDAILQTSRERACDLIVMGTHARRRLTRLLLGSETQAVLAHSKIPVLICPPPPSGS